MSNIKLVIDAYNDVEHGLTTNVNLLKKRNKSLKDVDEKEIKNILKVYMPESYSISQPVKKVKNYRSYSTRYVGELIHVDLMFLNTTKNTDQKIIIEGPQYQYLLVAVDVYSRMIFTRLLKTKKQADVNLEIKSIVDEINLKYYGGSSSTSYNILVDDGKEFPNKSYHNYRFTVSKNKWGAVIAEYAIYKIRNKIRKIDQRKTKRISKKQLNGIVYNLNTTLNKNLSDQFTPFEVFYDMKKPNQGLKIIEEKPRKFEPGNLVRLVNYFERNKTFTKKSSVSSYTNKIFAVLYVEQDKIQNIWQYKLISIGNNFVLDQLWYEEELTRVEENVRDLLTVEKIQEFESFSPEEVKFYKIRDSKEEDFK